MKSTFLTLLLLILAIPVFAFDELWQQAQEAVERSYRLVPGQSTLQMSAQGAGITARVTHTLLEDNTIHNELVFLEITDPETRTTKVVDPSDLSTLGDFKDIVQLVERDMVPSKSGMFFETDTDNIRVRRTREVKRVNRRNCQSFNVRMGSRSERMEGTVWIDIERGVPVLAEMQIPMLGQRVSIDSHYSYNNRTEQVYLSSMETTMSVEFMGVKVGFKIVTTFENHWEYPEL